MRGSDTSLVFLYGTLRHLPLLEIVAGVAPRVQAAWLPGHLAFRAEGKDYPLIAEAPGHIAEGLLAHVTPAQRTRLDFYEGGHGYDTRLLRVETEDGVHEAAVYWPPAGGPAQAEPWDLTGWIAARGTLQCLAAGWAMEMVGRQSAEAVAKRFPSLLARAQARLNAQEDVPPTQLRHRAAPGDLEIRTQVTPYAEFFAVEEIRLRHRSYAGAMTPEMHRTGFVSADATTVLPYDPDRDRVLLIEQLRVGPILRGDPQPWSLEAIAGRIDPGETPQDTALREAKEEAGLEITRLIPIGGYYPSPGAKTEFLYSFIGLADLPDAAAGLGGLLAEGEDIRAHVVPFETLMDAVASGEAGNAPLILSALHLARLRDELRSERRAVFTRRAPGQGRDPA